MRRLLLATILGGCLLLAQPAGERWDHATVMGIENFQQDNMEVGRAVICYAQPSGCRVELVEVKREAYRSSSFDAPPKTTVRDDVIAKAMHRLGTSGYGLVSAQISEKSEHERLFFRRTQR